jgi:exo-1,4-beta-D-glucosaminidase
MLRLPRWSKTVAVLGASLSSLVMVHAACGQEAQSPVAPATEAVFLHRGWQLQSSCVAKTSGENISTAGFAAAGWHQAEIPATVVGALVADKTYPDPDVAMNLKSLPGMDYSTKTFFAIQEMPKDSPFRCSWWFRTEFASPSAAEHANTFLHFLGINYRANIWLNGKKLANEKEVAAKRI